MFHNSFKEKMDNLEAEKTRISSYINEIKATMNSSELNEKLIEQYLIKDITAINEKSANDLKTIINTYVESVLVHEDKVDINLILFFVHINGGGEGTCYSIIYNGTDYVLNLILLSPLAYYESHNIVL